MDIAVHLAREIRKPRETEALVEIIQQGEIGVCAVEAQIERRAARDLTLYPQLRIIRQPCAEEINRQIVPAQDKGGVCTLHRNIAVHAIRELRTAKNRE